MSTADRILFFIKTQGPSSTAKLAQALDLTPEATRQQVQKLVVSGWIESQQQVSSGVGRPHRSWVLTEAGNQRFPNTHAQLTVQLIGSIRDIFGESGLDRLISQREAQTRTVYLQTCTGKTLQSRLKQLAAIRTDEGYMAHIESDGEDWLLMENHCPICAAAQACQGFCRSELQLFQEVSGPHTVVTREQHLLTGSTRCVYRITATKTRA